MPVESAHLTQLLALNENKLDKNGLSLNSIGIDLAQALALLRDIGADLNQLDHKLDLTTMLQRIVQGTVQAIIGGRAELATGVDIWIYDPVSQNFDLGSRISAGALAGFAPDYGPRPDGFGIRAVRQRRRILSTATDAPRIHSAIKQRGVRLLVCFPLIAGGEAAGAMYVYRCQAIAFSDIELLLLDNFAQLAALTIFHGRQLNVMTQALERKVREMEKIKWASQVINSRTKLDETLQEILYIALDMTAAQYGSLELFDKQRNLLVTKALAGSEVSLSDMPPLPINRESVVGLVAITRGSVRIADLQEEVWTNIYRPLLVDKTMRSELAVPILRADGGLEGVINVESPVPRTFTESDQHLLENLAAQAVIAIEEVRLLDALQEIVSVLLTSRADDLFDLVIERACALVDACAGAIWILTDDEQLVLRRSNDGRQPGEQVPLHGSLAGQAIQVRQPIIVDEMRTHPNPRIKELGLKKGWVSAIVVPMFYPYHHTAVGSFSLYADYLRDFSDWDKKLLTCLANHAALAIRDAEQRVQLKQAQERQVLAETFAAIGDVGSNLVHQLNNKFGAISVQVQGIEEKCAVALEQWPYLAESLQEIARSSREAIHYVRDSMAHLRLAHPQPVDLLTCLNRAIQRADPGREIEITVLNGEPLPKVLAGETQLEMVFYNLIDNAVKAMGGMGKIRLETHRREGQIGLSVTDTGPGVAPEMCDRIFEFAATGTSLTGSSQRLGFGLWWVKTFVERFGGRVVLDSKPGRGSTFTVWLPAQEIS